MTAQPLVSFLLSCHNGDQWLGDALQSIASQTFTEFEAILINDGSTDNSREMLEAWAKHDSRCRVFSKERSGLPDSLNFGLSNCSGLWVARLDADDICEIDRIEQQVDAVFENDQLVLVGSSFYTFEQTNGHKHLVRVQKSHRHLVGRLETMRSFFPHSSAFIDRKMALNIGGYRPAYEGADDWDLWLRLSEVGKITAVQDPLVTIRIHGQQMTANNDGRPQVLDSYLGSATHFIRKFGGVEPRPTNASDDFARLKNQISQSLLTTRSFDLFSLIRLLQMDTSKYNIGILKLLHTINALRRNRLLTLAVRHKLLGSKIPKSAASSFLQDLSNPDINLHQS